MGDTWITDMSHFDYRDDEVDRIPKSALKLWRYFGEIVAATVTNPPSCRSTGIPCRRRPHHAACNGVIESELIPPGNELRWWCPVCADNGQISNWENTRWDPSRGPMLLSIQKSGELFREEAGQNLSLLAPEVIEGTIEWDEGKDGELPKIVTVRKTYTWEELGSELMSYEGFHVRIKLG